MLSSRCLCGSTGLKRLVHQAQPRRSISMSVATQGPGAPETGVLEHTEDYFEGVQIDASKLPLDPEVFSHQLQHSLTAWRAKGRRGVWLKLPLSHVDLVAPAVKLGMQPHHAAAGYIQLTTWLAESVSMLPIGASHQVGVGAWVVNEHKEVLVVQERSGPLKGRGVWKMPTGMLNHGEDLHVAAEREVLEETGIYARFDCLLALRQAHGFSFGTSDLFCVVALRPEPGQTEVTPQESEIEAAKWMPLAEYMAQPFQQGTALYDKLRERCQAYTLGRYRGWEGAKLQGGLPGIVKPRQDMLFWGPDTEPQATVSSDDTSVQAAPFGKL